MGLRQFRHLAPKAMRFVVAYLILQVVLLVVVGLQNPIVLVAIPVGLVASYAAMVLVTKYLFGEGPSRGGDR